MLGGLNDLDFAVRPIDLTDVLRIRYRLAQDFGMLLMQAYVGGRLAFGGVPADAGPPGLDHLLADLQLLFRQPQDSVVRLGELGRHSYLLRSSERDRLDL